MPLTPVPGFSTLTFTPQWDVSFSVEFKNKERLLGNGYSQITDGGNANPEEIVSIDIIRTSSSIDTTIADLRAFQGSTPFNWRLHPGGNYKLYYCTEFTDSMQSLAYDAFTATFMRHPDPQYDPQPAVVADGVPWGVLTQPIAWEESPQNYEATPNIFGYRSGEVAPRKPKSLFAARSSKGNYRVVFPYLSQARYEAIDLFLRQRRGRIPFQFSHDANNVLARLWICSRYNVTLLKRDTADTVNAWRMELELREVYRAAPVNAIATIPTANVAPASATIPEGSSTSYTVTLSGASLSSVTIPFTMSGTAINGTDYTVTTSPIIISTGQTTATITINALTDAASEGNETAIVTLGTPTNATLGANITTTTTITNVSVALPTVSISPASMAIAEGTATTYTVTLSSVSASTVTVPFTMSGTAINGTDYTVTSSPLTIAAGQTTASITVSASTDANTETSETAIITLGTPTNATLGTNITTTTTILDPTAEDPVVTNWVTAVGTAGGTVSTLTRSSMDTFVKGCKADNIWTKMSAGLIMPFASNDFAGALVPLIAPAGATFTPTLLTSADYSLSTGIDPGATNTDPKRIATNINAQTLFTLASTQVSVFRPLVRTGRDTVVNTINGADVLNRLQFHLPWEDGTVTFDAFDYVVSEGRINFALANPTGLVSGIRTTGNTSLYRNGAAIASSANNNTSPVPNATVNLIGCFDSGFSFYSRSQTAYIYAGAALTAAEEALHSVRVQALQVIREDAIVTAWVNATVAAGGAVSTARRSAMDVFVKGCKADGIWTKMATGVVLPFGSTGFAGFLVPLVAPSGATFTNNNFTSTDYAAIGLDPGTGNTTRSISTNIVASSIFSATNIQASIYQNLIRGNGGYVIHDGTTFPPASPRIVLYKNESGFDRWDVFDATAGAGRLSATTSGVGLLTASKSGTTSTIYKNAVSQSASSTSGGTFPAANVLTLLALDSSRTCYIYLGQALTAAEELLHYNRVQALQTAWGRQV